MTETDDLDAQVKAADPDRWMATRFIADAQARADVVALYAFNHALARIAEQVTEPMMGHIRLAWWREAIDELFAGQEARAHPGVLAMQEPINRRAFAQADLDALIDARATDFDTETVTTETALYAHIDATASKLAAVAARRLDGASPPEAVVEAMRAWGLAGLARNGRLPAQWGPDELARRVDGCLAASRVSLKALPVAAFPAVAYAAFARDYARGRERGPLGKQLKLLTASLTGSL